MKTMKVGTWYNKLTEKEKAHFSNAVASFDVNMLRSYYTAARKAFNGSYTFERNLCVSFEGELYSFSYDRKAFFKVGKAA